MTVVGNRQEYNQCMVPYMTGHKPKEQRKLDFCIGAKVCSSKVSTKEEAERLCRLPKTKGKKGTVATVVERNPCADISSMQIWIKGGTEEECRPCLLPPIIQWYRDELSENGLAVLASEIGESVESGDPDLIAWTFDSIKAKVPESVRQRLREFDCHAQLHKEE